MPKRRHKMLQWIYSSTDSRLIDLSTHGLMGLLIAFCMFLCLVYITSGIAGEATDKIFRQNVLYYVGNGTRSVAGGDLDGDGDTDLLTANLRTSKISMFLNSGDGTFRGSSEYAVQNGPLAMHARDLDGDGDVDLAVLCFSASKISILLNRGTSSLTVAASYDVTGSPSDLCIGDFNADGKIDLATANSNSGDLAVLFNKGDGSFSGDVRIPLPENPLHILRGDFNGDGRDDLAAASSNSIYVLMNSGGEQPPEPPLTKRGVPFAKVASPFADYKAYDAGRGIQALATGDFNGDGDLDLAVANSTSDLWVFFNEGNGALQRQASYKAGDFPHSLVVMDVSRDSKPDLVVANRKSKDLSVFINHGDGTFDQETRYELRMEPSAMYAADLDSDGEGVDLAVVSTSAASLAVLINTYGKK
jgi:hypothetical protein